MPNPFILTAKLPDEIHYWADALRREHFPPERNHLQGNPVAEITGLMDLGKGTAIRLHSPELLAIRSLISEHFHGSLTDQDLHEPRPHITIQNKVTKEEARELQAELAPEIERKMKEGRFVFPALELHLYKGGPWEFVKGFPFRTGSAGPSKSRPTAGSWRW